MKRVVTWALVSAALLGTAATASAVLPANGDKPFLVVSTTPKNLDLGTAPMTGPFQVDGAFIVNVDTNCKLGPIYVEATSLKHSNGTSIEPENILVRTPSTQGFVAINKPMAISSPTTGSNKIAVDVKVLTKVARSAGEYSGVFTFTIAPPV